MGKLGATLVGRQQVKFPLVGLGANMSRHAFCKNTKLSDFPMAFSSDTKGSFDSF